MNLIKTIKCIGAAAVMFGGLFSASSVLAYGGHGYYRHDNGHHYGHYRDYDDDDYYRRYKRHRYHPGYYGGYYGGHRRYYRSYRHYRRYGGHHYGGRHRYGGHYYHNNTDLGIHDVAFNDLGGRLEVEGIVTGMTPNSDVVLTLEAMSDLRSSCPKAQFTSLAEPIDIQSEGTRTYERANSRDAQLQVVLTSDDAAEIAEDLVSCPGSRVTPGIDQVDFLDARVDIVQGDKVLTLLCTFTTATEDGPVAPENVECSAF